jgi:hypothetical protein
MTDSTVVADDKLTPIENDKTEREEEVPATIPEQKFLRTATLKFQVKNVEKASGYIEKKTRQLGGYVGNSAFANSVLNSDLTSVGPDSLLTSTHYSLTGNLILRIPDFRLDSLLDEVQSLSIFLDSRLLTYDDVSLKIFENQLTQQRARISNQRVGHYLGHPKNKLRDIQSTDITLYDRSKISDEALLSNYLLQQQVQYSTVNISISQEPIVVTKIVAKEKITLPYEEPFLKRLAGSFSASFIDMEDIVIGITRIWILLGIILMAGFYVKRNLLPVKKV